MPNDKDIRDHLEAALGLSLKADYSLLAYIIAMALLEFANTEVYEAVASMKSTSERVDDRSE